MKKEAEAEAESATVTEEVKAQKNFAIPENLLIGMLQYLQKQPYEQVAIFLEEVKQKVQEIR